MYPLPLTKATPVSRHMIGAYRVVILTDCQGIGAIQYAHAAMVYPPDSQRPIYAVASESNAMAKFMGGGSHFLCTYDDQHGNYGSSDDWADLVKFTQEALRLITEHFTEAPADPSQTPAVLRLHKQIDEYQAELKGIDPKIDPDNYGLIYLKLGDAFSNLDKLEFDSHESLFEAVIAYKRASEFLSRAVHPNEYVDALLGFASNRRFYAMSGDNENALLIARDDYQKAIAELIKLPEPPTSDRILKRGMAYEALGDIFNHLKQTDDALQQWRLAHQTYQQYENGHTHYIGTVSEKIAALEGKT